jgi:hypothetical protein
MSMRSILIWSVGCSIKEDVGVSRVADVVWPYWSEKSIVEGVLPEE